MTKPLIYCDTHKKRGLSSICELDLKEHEERAINELLKSAVVNGIITTQQRKKLEELK